jgi:hypothetical protein
MSQRRFCSSQLTSAASCASPSIVTAGLSPAIARAISSSGLLASTCSRRSGSSGVCHRRSIRACPPAVMVPGQRRQRRQQCRPALQAQLDDALRACGCSRCVATGSAPSTWLTTSSQALHQRGRKHRSNCAALPIVGTGLRLPGRHRSGPVPAVADNPRQPRRHAAPGATAAVQPPATKPPAPLAAASGAKPQARSPKPTMTPPSCSPAPPATSPRTPGWRCTMPASRWSASTTSATAHPRCCSAARLSGRAPVFERADVATTAALQRCSNKAPRSTRWCTSRR